MSDNDLRGLYQEVILDHNRRPRNFGAIASPTHHADGHNPLCGDRLSLTLTVQDGVITNAMFQGSGCAISKASASLMTDAVKGHSVVDAEALFEAFHKMVTTPMDEEPDESAVGKLAVFSGVREFPARVKCASLAWHTLKAALSGAEIISTE
ncbi:MAG: SUF system NifU family Fe-S cluster assembly protein [Acidobacteria bacterium]|nr:MAG: SUF system NifU family Fe-S cluster assembly protein [Acidobacteriota bacterium]